MAPKRHSQSINRIIKIYRSFLFGIVFLLTLGFAKAAPAHVGQPRLEISVERMNPGGIVDVRGVSFGMDDSVNLALIGSGVDVSFGEIIASGEGEFIYIAVLPSDLVEGTYYFRAVTSHHYVFSPLLTVWGTAFIEGGGQGPRDEDDGLLAPANLAAGSCDFPCRSSARSNANFWLESTPSRAGGCDSDRNCHRVWHKA